jgi:hypothetical protein
MSFLFVDPDTGRQYPINDVHGQERQFGNLGTRFSQSVFIADGVWYLSRLFDYPGADRHYDPLLDQSNFFHASEDIPTVIGDLEGTVPKPAAATLLLALGGAALLGRGRHLRPA